MVWFLLPEVGRISEIDGRSVLLGAALMLVGTEAAAWFALLFGTLGLVGSPIFLAVPIVAPIGAIFAQMFGGSLNPGRAEGSIFAGAAVGGLGQSLSMLTGFRYLLPVAAAFFLLSLLPRSSISRDAMT